MLDVMPTFLYEAAICFDSDVAIFFSRFEFRKNFKHVFACKQISAAAGLDPAGFWD